MKNLKIKAVYAPTQDVPEFNIFREVLINFNTCEIIIKDVNYDELLKGLINLYNIIKKLKNVRLQHFLA